jgi:hypothetical protein
MAQIKNLEGLSVQQVRDLVDQGGKFVVFQYCISIVVMTFKRGSGIYFIRPDEGTMSKSIGFTLLSFVMGWWGIPWGPIYTIGAIYTNLSGGKDVTADIMAHFASSQPQAPSGNGGYNVPGSGNGASNGGYNVPGNNNDSSTGSYNIPR